MRSQGSLSSSDPGNEVDGKREMAGVFQVFAGSNFCVGESSFHDSQKKKRKEIRNFPENIKS